MAKNTSTVTFISTSPSGQLLSNNFQCTIVWNDVCFLLGPEQAFAYAKASMIIPKINFEYHIYRARILAARTPAECTRIGNQLGDFSIYSRAYQKFDKVAELVMLPIVLTKFAQNPSLKHVLLATGDNLLVEAHPNDKRWGAGLSEQFIIQQIQWAASKNATWSPRVGSNKLGEILMSVRSYLKGESNLPTSILIGDSIVKDVIYEGSKCCWPGADIAILFQLLDFIMLPTVRLVIFHGGTNDISKHKPWIHREPQEYDEANQIGYAQATIRYFIEHLLRFDRRWNKGPQRENKTAFRFSEILFRHCDTPVKHHLFQPGALSVAQEAGASINDAIREFCEGKMRFAAVIDHSIFYNPRYFRKDPNGSFNARLNSMGVSALAVSLRNYSHRFMDE